MFLRRINTIYAVLESLKHLWGDGATFHADVSRDGHYTCKGMVYTKIFSGGMVLFSGGMASPASPFNSSTDYMSIYYDQTISFCYESWQNAFLHFNVLLSNN